MRQGVSPRAAAIQRMLAMTKMTKPATITFGLWLEAMRVAATIVVLAIAAGQFHRAVRGW
jgi:hypothetical protein